MPRASVRFTIEKADLPVVDWPEPVNSSYDGELHALVKPPIALPAGAVGLQYSADGGANWIDAIPEKGKHVDHWTYVWTDEDGKKHTETADDPTKFTVKGKGIITPVFVDDPVEEPKKSNTTEGGKTDKGSKAQSASRQPGNRQAAYKGNRSDKLPQTSDETNLALPFGLMGLGALLIILAAKRRKDEEEAEA